MPVKSRGLALLTVTGFAVALTACSSGGSSTSSPAAGHATAATAGTPATAAASGTASGGPAVNSPASGLPATASATASAAVPAGYKRVGGTAQGISVAVPASWADVDLAEESPAAAAKKLNVPGITATELTQDMTQLQKVHAIFVADVASAAAAPGNFARNLNAYCNDSGVTESGSAGVSLLRQSAQTELGNIASDITVQDENVGGIPGTMSTYEVHSANVGTLYGSQLGVLPKAGQACYVTLTGSSPQQKTGILAVAAATAQFP